MAIEPKKVSELEVVENLTGEELIPIVQGGQNKAAKVKTINSSFVQELTLAELQAIQFTDAPAPTGITITPDAVGDNPVTWYAVAIAIDNVVKRTVISEEIVFIVGDDTTELLLDGITSPSTLRFCVGLESGTYNFWFEANTNDLPVFANAYIENWDSGNTFDFPLIKVLNALPIGQQYYVTDKDWLLYVDSPTVLKPVKGSLHIFNGETLPEGIEPDVLFIDTGVVDYDISTSTGSPLAIQLIQGFLIHNARFVNSGLTDLSGVALVEDLAQQGVILSCGELGQVMDKTILFQEASWYILNHTLISMISNGFPLYLIGSNNDSTGNIRVIIEFHRSELSFPIPVPHIVSAEIGEYGSIEIKGNDIWNINSVAQGFADFSFKKNGVVIGDLLNMAPLNNLLCPEFDVSTFVYGDVITFSIASGNIKNIWGGLLEEVVDYPVVNNVPA